MNEHKSKWYYLQTKHEIKLNIVYFWNWETKEVLQSVPRDKWIFNLRCNFILYSKSSGKYTRL